MLGSRVGAPFRPRGRERQPKALQLGPHVTDWKENMHVESDCLVQVQEEERKVKH